MKKTVFVLGLAVFAVACQTSQVTEPQKQNMTQKTHTQSETNPLLQASKLPYGAPDFNKIENHHYLPAMRHAMDLQKQRVLEIAKNTAAPNFANTILELEKSGYELDRVASVFYSMAGAHTNDVIRDAQKQLAPLMAAHRDEIFLNEDLFKKVQFVYSEMEKSKIEGEDKILTREYFQDFFLSGATLSKEDKATLKDINSQIATLQTQFNQTLQSANNAAKIVVKDKSELAGLSDEQIKALQNEDGTYSIAILNTTGQPLLSSLQNRKLRQHIFEAGWNRTNGGEFNTNQIILKLAQLRAQKAKLLSFDEYASWSLVNTMVKNPETIRTFFDGMIPAVNKKAEEEAKAIQKMMAADGIKDKIQPWDWSFYSEKVRKAKYDLDENEIKPYFELNRVLEDGVFYSATQLFGVTFKERKDIPVYHPDVVVYEIFEEDGTPLALFYGDFFARESKRGGAWMGNFVSQSHLYNQKPVIYNVCNYQKPADGMPALITYDDAETLFHEFGHTLHGLFADQKYPKLSGTSVARDFVEFPSQANEHWVLDSKVLQNYAKHYKTGEVIPQSLIKKIKDASTFNQGFAMYEVLAAANLDYRWHTLSYQEAENIKDPNDFEKEILIKDNLWNEQIPPRYRSSYFAHIFGGGYAAGYYSYLWTEMLALDTGAWFEESGGLDRKLGQRYRDMILSRGNTMDYKEMYKAFRGSDPKQEVILKSRGLN
ncbi:MAG: M3 family metallopeptidase [Flavobacteriaceae bacterium]|nr:M3 family metallopeptidase [Flavobacteriaceae bacterium]